MQPSCGRPEITWIINRHNPVIFGRYAAKVIRVLRRSKCLLVFVVIAVLATAFVFEIADSRRLPPEEVDSRALESIDHSKLPLPVHAFIQHARKNQTIGRSVTQFPDLWANALPIDSEDLSERFRWYKFILPMTAERIAENNAKIENEQGVLYWPMLYVRVDTNKSTIVRVALFTQGL